MQRCLGLILARRLAHGRGIALDVEQIIGDLEGEAEALAVGCERPAIGIAGPPQDGAGLAGEAQEGPRFHGLQALHVSGGRLGRDCKLLGFQIEALPARHAAETGSTRQRLHQLDPHRRIGMRFGPRCDVEGERQQTVAGEDGGRVVERLVHRRLAAAEIVIVHRRQVVVHQRIAVHAFDGSRRFDRHSRLHAEQAGTFGHEKGAKPLATAKRPVPHGGDQPAGRAGGGSVVEQLRQPCLYEVGRLRQALAESHVFSISCRRPW